MSRSEGPGDVRAEAITLGGGCFWCLEAVFLELDGVHAVVSGYAGGTAEDPTYEAVCSGQTGHAEVVQLVFDPDVIRLDDLLRIFFAVHDPTTLNRQGADVGTQYRSIILTGNDEQAAVARQVKREIEESGMWGDPIVTEIAPLVAFHPAEEIHSRYYERNPRQPYCQFVIAPKVAKFRQLHRDRLKTR